MYKSLSCLDCRFIRELAVMNLERAGLGKMLLQSSKSSKEANPKFRTVFYMLLYTKGHFPFTFQSCPPIIKIFGWCFPGTPSFPTMAGPQPASPSQVGKSSTFLILPQILINFSYFFSYFSHFLPHFGSPVGEPGPSHPGRPWLHYCTMGKDRKNIQPFALVSGISCTYIDRDCTDVPLKFCAHTHTHTPDYNYLVRSFNKIAQSYQPLVECFLSKYGDKTTIQHYRYRIQTQSLVECFLSKYGDNYLALPLQNCFICK